MEIQSFEIIFKTRDVKPSHLVNADPQLREILNEMNPTQSNHNQSTFVEQMDELRSRLIQHDGGAFEMSAVPTLRKHYVRSRAHGEGATASNLIHYQRVFDAVVSRALFERAKELTKHEAREFDCELVDIQKETGLFFRPETKEGDVYLPCKMEDIAFMDDELEGTWSENEPYANLFTN